MIHVGIDMHGTLITDREERIPPALVAPLVEALTAVRSPGIAKVYLCTGNELAFAKRKIEPEVLAQFDGHVLELGCVISDGASETVLAPAETVDMMRSLERALFERDFPEVYKFGERRVAIAAFTKHGTAPETLQPKVQAVVDERDLVDRVRVVCSSVAVDVVPVGFSKRTGMRRVARGEPVMGIADSMNDAELVLGADLAAVPRNVKPELAAEIERTGAAHVYTSGRDVAAAVIDVLHLVAEGRFPGQGDIE
jgi:hydroxymethylpyrimidine pyrophosphatase-like HAD family hydrolase